MAAEIEEIEAPGTTSPDGDTQTQKNTVEENRRLRRDYRNFAKSAEGKGPLSTRLSHFEPHRIVAHPKPLRIGAMTPLPGMGVQRTQTGSWT